MIRSYVIKIFAILLTMVAEQSFSQGLYNNGSTISINNGAIFSVQGDATNNGTIINNGNFLVTGFWLNNNTYEPGTGDFTLNSSGDQVVNHNAQSFTRLVINGGGNKFFLADLEIIESLDLTNGLLISQNGAKIIAAENAEVKEGNNLAHVVGPFYHKGIGDKLFPVGNGTTYLPVLLLDIRGGSPEIGLRLLEPNPINLKSPDITQVSSNRAWQLDFSNATDADALAELILYNDDFIGEIDNGLVAFATQAGGVYTSLGNAASSGTSQSGFVRSANRINGSGTLAMAFRSPEFTPPKPEVYNVVTPNGDDKHDFLKILNIELYPQNTLRIFNRWGDELFTMQGYNNTDKIFTGKANLKHNSEIPEGTYYYVIDDGIGSTYSGFFLLKR
jgi:gliding motility-associated-like protein